MSDNTILNTGIGGDTIRNVSRNGVKTQVVQIDLGNATTESLLAVGQQNSQNSLPVTLASNQPPIIVSANPASALWGQALATTANSTSVLINIPLSLPNYKIKGFIGHGLGDGYFFVQVNNSTVFSSRTRSTYPVTTITLPNGIVVTAGSQITLKVTNESGSTSDYEATLLGE